MKFKSLSRPGWRRLLVRWISASTLLAVSTLGIATAGPGAPLLPVAGSPFTTGGGDNSNVVLVSPDGKRLFVSNQDSSSVSVFNIAASGALSYVISHAVPLTSTNPRSAPTGLAISPDGTHLYVAVCEDEVAVFAVASNGMLTLQQQANLGVDDQNCAAQGLVYVAHPEGAPHDYLYVNNGWAPNTVTRFRVETSGLLTRLGVTTLGGDAGGGGLFATPTVRSMQTCVDGCHLFLANGSTFGGTNDISVCAIDPVDGSLVEVPGSPFALPNDEISSGSIVLAPGDEFLFAGTWDGDIVRFPVSTDGTLGAGVVAPTGVNAAINGLEVHPCGEFLVATLGPDVNGKTDALANQIATLRTDTLTHVAGSPQVGNGSAAAGLAFNPTGKYLFSGNAVTGGQQISAYRFNAYGDLTPPACGAILTRPGPPVQIDVLLQDTGSGIAAIVPTLADNCTVAIDFAPGTRAPVLVTATKVDSRFRARLELTVTDCAGNVMVCDPIVAEIVIPARRSQIRQRFNKIPSNEHFVTVQNGSPGIHRIAVRANGKSLARRYLASGEVLALDAQEVFKRGNNSVAITARGEPGSKALLVIADAPVSGGENHLALQRVAQSGGINLEWNSR